MVDAVHGLEAAIGRLSVHPWAVSPVVGMLIALSGEVADASDRGLAGAGRSLQLRVDAPLAIRSAPSWHAPVIGALPSRSRYLRAPVTAWVTDSTGNGRWGRVAVPWSASPEIGWVPLEPRALTTTRIGVRVSLRARAMSVSRSGRVLLRVRVAVGARESPTPTGAYFVTDRVATRMPHDRGPFGHYAFGLSGIQTRLPRGWSGGDQLAIHGTDALDSIGRAATAGCIRVSTRTLDRLRPLLRPGTPVVVAR